MIKRTLYFGNPAYLKTINGQLVVERKDELPVQLPIEDLGMVILDHQQITITQALLARLQEANVALVTCNGLHHPVGMMLNLDGHTLQSQHFKSQMAVSQPLKKQLWQQTVVQKISNQAALLAEVRSEHQYLLALARGVKSDDSANSEAVAAAYYWKRLFPDFLNFSRHREGAPPNNLLNYGYALLRAATARALVGSGLLPTLGIHHRNQYNAYCLADDIMEPYRRFVDRVVYQLVRTHGQYLDMSPSMKKTLLQIPTLDVQIDGLNSPLMVALSRTTASLVKCYEGSVRKILYPVLISA